MPIEVSTDELLRDLEMQLLDLDFRRDTSRVLELLADEFTEIGTRSRSQQVVVKDWDVRELYPTVMLCTYRTVSSTGREVLRSSVWVERAGRWLMTFHQGTPIPDSW